MPAWHIFIFGLLCSNVFLLFPSLFLLLALHMQQPALVFLEAEHCLFDRIEGQQQRGRAVPSEVSSEHNTTSTHTPLPKIRPPQSPLFTQMASGCMIETVGQESAFLTPWHQLYLLCRSWGVTWKWWHCHISHMLSQCFRDCKQLRV